jgi:hypothetical protein
MRERVTRVVQDHLGIARGAAGEVHEHGVGGRSLASGEVGRGRAHLAVEVAPARALGRGRADALGPRERRACQLALADEPGTVGILSREARAGRVHQDERLHAGALPCHGVHHIGDVAGTRAHHGLDVGALEAVRQIVLLQHEGSRHCHRAQLRQGQHGEPELIVAPQNDHDEVAATDAALREEVGRLVRPVLHVGEGEDVLLAFGVTPHHGGAVGVGQGDVVHHVVGEVEVGGHVHVELGEQAVVVVGLGDVTFVDMSHDRFLVHKVVGER